MVAATDKPAESKDTTDTKTTNGTVDPQVLKVAALEDANRIQMATLSIDLDKIGTKDARIIMSEEHKSLGYRPPPDSLAAKAQRSSAKHPNSSLGLDAAMLREAARADAERIKYGFFFLFLLFLTSPSRIGSSIALVSPPPPLPTEWTDLSTSEPSQQKRLASSSPRNRRH